MYILLLLVVLVGYITAREKERKDEREGPTLIIKP